MVYFLKLNIDIVDLNTEICNATCLNVIVSLSPVALYW